MFRKLSKIEIETWKCNNCKENILRSPNNGSKVNNSIVELENSLIENNLLEDSVNKEDKLEMAAKIGSVLLEKNKLLEEENIKLEAQIASMNERNIRLEASVANMEDELAAWVETEQKYINQIETLSEELKELKCQLNNEKMHHQDIKLIFEEQDKISQQTIDEKMAKIKKLEKTILTLQRQERQKEMLDKVDSNKTSSSQMSDDNTTETLAPQSLLVKIYKNCETQTEIIPPRDSSIHLKEINHLQQKINELERANTQLMERIQPFPLSDMELEKKLSQAEVKRKEMERQIKTAEQIIKDLLNELESCNVVETSDGSSNSLKEKQLSPKFKTNVHKTELLQRKVYKRSTKSSKDNGKTTKYRKNHFSVSLQVVKSRKPIPNAEPEDTAKMSAESRSATIAPSANCYKKKRRVLVVADSHGKNVANQLQDELPDYDVTVVCNPGATFNYVANNLESMTEDYTNEDVAVFMAGTNDVDKLINGKEINTNSFNLDKLGKVALRTNLRIIDIPFRFDRPEKNFAIHCLNSSVHKYISSRTNALYCNTTHFERSEYTTHGLHLNYNGKISLTKLISNSVKVGTKQHCI